jgi:phosphoribosylglycinamide formyltransferase 1
MARSVGPKKLKTAIFISGTGSNFKNLIKFSLRKKSPIKVVFVVSDNPKAKGLRFAKKYKIEKKIYNFKYLKKSENKIIKEFKENNINLICLAGFMKILSKNFIKKFNGKILNIHPSLLPKYKGINTHNRVIENNEKVSGCTVHIVNSKLDSGKIIMQKQVKVFKKDTPTMLARRILKQEHILYPKAIKKILSNL